MATIAGDAGVADLYWRLGLAPGAPLAEVKHAYRRLAPRLHPDQAGNGSVQTFLAVKTAYEWIVAHPSRADPGDHRPGSIPRPTTPRPVRRAPPMTARPRAPQAGRQSWPGGRWYWEGIRERAARR
jgi:DnaJ domain